MRTGRLCHRIWPWCGKTRRSGSSCSGLCPARCATWSKPAAAGAFYPHDLLPWPAVNPQWGRWRDNRCFEHVLADLRCLVRLLAGQKAEPTAVILDFYSPRVWWSMFRASHPAKVTGQILHGSARITQAIRRSDQRSQESLQALAKRHSIAPKMVAKWRKRTTTTAAMGPKPA
jgi:hypothetical protein